MHRWSMNGQSIWSQFIISIQMPDVIRSLGMEIKKCKFQIKFPKRLSAYHTLLWYVRFLSCWPFRSATPSGSISFIIFITVSLRNSVINLLSMIITIYFTIYLRTCILYFLKRILHILIDIHEDGQKYQLLSIITIFKGWSTIFSLFASVQRVFFLLTPSPLPKSVL